MDEKQIEQLIDQKVDEKLDELELEQFAEDTANLIVEMKQEIEKLINKTQ